LNALLVDVVQILKPDKLDNESSTSQDVDLTEDANLTQFHSVENVIKKVIRVLSNAAISPENGSIIIRRDESIDLLFRLLSNNTAKNCSCTCSCR
jgi:hypothetical protein